MAGARSTAQLLQEPQNLLTASTKTPSGDTTAVTVNTSNAPNIPAQLQPLVQLQLNALETRQVLWQGQVWPNQKMDWEIHEETPRRSAAEYDSAGAQWATQIRLDLPNLGEVAALLRFNQHGLSITLDAADADTRALFGSASSQLAATLAERGINVFSTLLASHDKP
jgi:flagellar hook-length control protein FliK